jgi:hypothetical protein
MGFGDDFKIVVSDMSAYKQFGNSVAIKVIEVLAEKIVKTYFTLTTEFKQTEIKITSPINSNNKTKIYDLPELSR